MNTFGECWEVADEVERGLLFLLLPAWPILMLIYFCAGLLGKALSRMFP